MSCLSKHFTLSLFLSIQHDFVSKYVRWRTSKGSEFLSWIQKQQSRSWLLIYLSSARYHNPLDLKNVAEKFFSWALRQFLIQLCVQQVVDILASVLVEELRPMFGEIKKKRFYFHIETYSRFSFYSINFQNRITSNCAA